MMPESPNPEEETLRRMHEIVAQLRRMAAPQAAPQPAPQPGPTYQDHLDELWKLIEQQMARAGQPFFGPPR